VSSVNIESMIFDSESNRLLLSIAWESPFNTRVYTREVFWLNPDGSNRTDLLREEFAEYEYERTISIAFDSVNQRLIRSMIRGTVEAIEFTPEGAAVVTVIDIDAGSDIDLYLGAPGVRSVLNTPDLGQGPAMRRILDVALDVEGRRAFVTTFNQNAIFVVDLETGDHALITP